jgi:hypothetical protein
VHADRTVAVRRCRREHDARRPRRGCRSTSS